MSQVATQSNITIFLPVNSFLRSIIQRMKKNREIRKTYEELNKLSDVELRDIGIHRSNIRAIAMEQYYDNRGKA